MTPKDDVMTAVEALIARWDAELPDHREQNVLWTLNFEFLDRSLCLI